MFRLVLLKVLFVVLGLVVLKLEMVDLRFEEIWLQIVCIVDLGVLVKGDFEVNSNGIFGLEVGVLIKYFLVKCCINDI